MTNTLDKITVNSSNNLKTVFWNASFLDTYATDDLEEQLIVNTVKNMITCSLKHHQPPARKKRKRIQWLDQVSKSCLSPAERLFANSKIMSSLKKATKKQTN